MFVGTSFQEKQEGQQGNPLEDYKILHKTDHDSLNSKDGAKITEEEMFNK